MRSNELWTDDEIIGAILAGSLATDRPLVAQAYFGNGFGNDSRIAEGPVCAVSAGLLWRGINSTTRLPTFEFAERYGLSDDVALGISAGFEDEGEDYEFGSYAPDYARGWAIGAAVRAAVEETESDPDTERLIAERSGK